MRIKQMAIGMLVVLTLDEVDLTEVNLSGATMPDDTTHD